MTKKSRFFLKNITTGPELNAQLASMARERGFVVESEARGNIYFIPIVNGKLLQRPQDFASLTDDERREVERRQQGLANEMERLSRKQQEIMREMEEDIRSIERRFCERLLMPILGRIKEELKNEEVNTYLAEVKDHVLDNLDIDIGG